MFRVHWLRLRATAHATEDPAKVRGALRFASGLDEDAFAAACTEQAVESHHGGSLVLLEATLRRARDVRACLDHLLDPAARQRLAPQADARTDEEGVFWFRLDKQAAAQGRVATTQGEDAIQACLKPEVHPASRARVVAAVAGFLEKEG